MKENGNWVNRTKKRADGTLQRKIDKEKFFKIFDLRNDVDFSGAIFELNKMLKNDYKGYEPSYEIDDVLSLLPISSCDNIVDLGCGKGYELYLLGKYAFGTIKGVEIDDNFVSITISNIRTLYPKDERFFFECKDIKDWEKYNEFNFFYLFNLFGEKTTTSVAKKICECAVCTKNRRYVIYQYPVHEQVFIDLGYEEILKGKDTIVLMYS